MNTKKLGNGWIVTGWLALLDLAVVTAVWTNAGLSEHGVRTLVLATARVSVVLFMAAFVASSLRKAWPNKATTWLLKNRRYVGVGFAFAHFVHLGTLVLFWTLYPVTFVDGLTVGLVAGGTPAYIFIALMTATSFDRPTRWLGAKRWKRLHTIGGYYIWFIFFATYAPRAINDISFGPIAMALLAVLGLRVWKARR